MNVLLDQHVPWACAAPSLSSPLPHTHTHALTRPLSSSATLGLYDDAITDASDFYPSTQYADELSWAAAWLYKATGTESYLTSAASYWSNNGLGSQTSFSWDTKDIGAGVLLADLHSTPAPYESAVETFLDGWISGSYVTYTPLGLAWWNEWGSLRYTANTALIAMVYAKQINHTDSSSATTYKKWARGQVGG